MTHSSLEKLYRDGIAYAVKKRDFDQIDRIVNALRFKHGRKYAEVAQLFIECCANINDVADFENLMIELEEHGS